MIKHNKHPRLLDSMDIPVVTFIGLSAGFFVVGLIQSTIGSIFDSGENEIFSTSAILAGVLCIAISVAILGLACAYWRLIPKRFGVVYPALTGFGSILALMALLSGAMLASELCSTILYTL